MTVAQTRAARRKFKNYYRSNGPIGQPRYRRKSVEALDRREQELRKKIRELSGRKKK